MSRCDTSCGCLGFQFKDQRTSFCDNHYVVLNSSTIDSTLQKEHNAINYHAVREAAASEIPRVGKKDGTTNLADLLTKILTGQKRRNLCYSFMW